MPRLKANETLLVIIGPSGSGKSSAIRELVDRGTIEVTPSWTTRPPRPGELENALEHHFVSPAELEAKQAQGYFLEVVQMFGLPFKYALPPVEHDRPGIIPTVMLRASLMSMLPKHYPNFITYQIEDSLPRVRERLMARKLQGEELGSRLQDYDTEVQAGRGLAQRIFINKDDIETLVNQLELAITEDFD